MVPSLCAQIVLPILIVFHVSARVLVHGMRNGAEHKSSSDRNKGFGMEAKKGTRQKRMAVCVNALSAL